MDEILYCLCRHCVSVMYGWYPYHATLTASNLGLSVSKVRYQLKKLKQQGIVESIHDGGMDDSGNVWCCKDCYRLAIEAWNRRADND